MIKRKKIHSIIACLLLAVVMTGCKTGENSSSKPSYLIFINQYAYGINNVKHALIKDFQGKFSIITADKGKKVFEGVTSELKVWDLSGERYSTADFSSLTKKGSYRLVLENGEQSLSFEIASNSKYSEVNLAALKSFYLNRASSEILPEYGGLWSRKAGHPDTNVIIHSSTAMNSTLDLGSVISSPGGWYDAGDFNKYPVNSAITVFTLLNAYNHFSEYYNQLNTNIPESKNTVPDILDEIMYNVRWMLTMQDSDGGVYHKLTTLNFDGFIMPDQTNKKRYVVYKTTSATLDFASSMAACSRIISDIEELQSLSDSCLSAAKLAWSWALENSDLFYIQPDDVHTGAYSDTNFTDEWLWASTEMFLATKDANFLNENTILEMPYPYTTPSWDVVHTLALISIVKNPNSFNKEFYTSVLKLYLGLVDELHGIYMESPARVSLDFFKWGSTSDVANQSMLAFIAYQLTNEEKYLQMATENVDYLLGRNPTGYSYVTGFGTISPMKIHHRISAADEIELPHSGFLIGGPNTIVLNDCGEEVLRSEFPALSYIDSECSYSTNECAINWTAPLVYCTAAMVELGE